MKRYLLIIIFFLTAFCPQLLAAQDFAGSKASLSNFIIRMYTVSPFEGVKIIDDYDHQYVISVVSLANTPAKSAATQNRVASIKARSLANTYMNGSTVSIETIIRTDENKTKNNIQSNTQMIEIIKENAMGFVEGMELLSTFETEEGKRIVYIYARELPNK